MSTNRQALVVSAAAEDKVALVPPAGREERLAQVRAEAEQALVQDLPWEIQATRSRLAMRARAPTAATSGPFRRAAAE